MVEDKFLVIFIHEYDSPKTYEPYYREWSKAAYFEMTKEDWEKFLKAFNEASRR